MQLLNVGTDSFVSKMLGGFNAVLVIMEAIKTVNSISSFLPIPGFASGGTFGGNSPMLVGERGAELIFPNTGGYVADAQLTQRLLNQSTNAQSPVNIYLSANVSQKYLQVQTEKYLAHKNYIKV